MWWDWVKRIFSDNIGLKIVSIVIAGILWAVVLGSRNIEVTKEIPIEIITPSDMVPSNEVTTRVGFRLAGPQAFLRVILDRRESPIKVDLSAAQKPGPVTYRFFSDNLKVPIGIRVLSISPASIVINLDQLSNKQVPVQVKLQGSSPEGYKITQSTVEPSHVTIQGAKSLIKKIRLLKTLPVDISGLREDEEREAALDLSEYNVTVLDPKVIVSLKTKAISPNFRVKNVTIRVKTNRKYSLSRKTVTVLVRALPEDLQKLDHSKVYAEVDLSDFKRGQYQRDINVVLPKSVALVKVIPSSVRVTLK